MMAKQFTVTIWNGACHKDDGAVFDAHTQLQYDQQKNINITKKNETNETEIKKRQISIDVRRSVRPIVRARDDGA